MITRTREYLLKVVLPSFIIIMKALIFIFYITCFYQFSIQESNYYFLSHVEDQLKKEKVDYYIKYTQRTGKGKNSKVASTTFIIVPSESNFVIKHKYKSISEDKFSLVVKDTITDVSKTNAVDNFVNNFKEIEKGKCYHYSSLDLPTPPVGASEYNVGYAKNEWLLTLVKKDLDGQYNHYFSFKHKLKNKCLSRKENIRIRKRVKKFKKIISS